MRTSAISLNSNSQKVMRGIRHVSQKSTPGFYSPSSIRKAFEKRSTPSLIKEAIMLRVLGNERVSKPLGKLIKKIPDRVLDMPPISWAFGPIASQFGTVNSNLNEALNGFHTHDVADLAKEGIKDHEDPKAIEARHLETIRHPNVTHMALKVSSFVPEKLLVTGIETPAYEKGVEMLTRICQEAEKLSKKIYIDAEGVPEQRLIEKVQTSLGMQFNNTVYLTFQSVRSDTIKTFERYLELCTKAGLSVRVKQVKGAYQKMESLVYPAFYNPTFEETDATFRAMIKMAHQFQGEKHQFIGSMNPEVIRWATETLNADEYVIANLKGMDVASAMGVKGSLLYHPIALKPSELAKYGVRRLIELGNPVNLTERRSHVVEEGLRIRLGIN